MSKYGQFTLLITSLHIKMPEVRFPPSQERCADQEDGRSETSISTVRDFVDGKSRVDAGGH